MPQTTTATAVFSNHRAAQRAIQRLANGGFARSSINAHRMYSDDDSYEVSVRVKEGNVQRAEDLLHAREDVHDFVGNSRFNLQPVLIAAGAVLLGAAGYALLARRSAETRRR